MTREGVPIFDYPVISEGAGSGVLDLASGETVETENVFPASQREGYEYDDSEAPIATVYVRWTPTKKGEWELVSATFVVPAHDEQRTERDMVQLHGVTRKDDGKHGGGKLGVAATTGVFAEHFEPVFLRSQNPKRWSIDGG